MTVGKELRKLKLNIFTRSRYPSYKLICERGERLCGNYSLFQGDR